MSTKRSNEVKFYIDEDFTMEFTQEGEIVITKDQPHDDSATSKWEFDEKEGKNLCTITINAGRKGSSEVAESFAREVEKYQAIATDNYQAGGMPDSLNFYVKGKMTITKKESDDKGGILSTKQYYADVILAQGHNARDRNNWWFASKSMVTFNAKFFVDATGIMAMRRNDSKEESSEGQIEVVNMKQGIISNMIAICIVQEKSENAFDVNKLSIQ